LQSVALRPFAAGFRVGAALLGMTVVAPLAAPPCFAQQASRPVVPPSPLTEAKVDAAADEARLLSSSRQLTFEGRRAGEGYFSPDGTQLVFQSERQSDNPFYQIYVLDLETGDLRRISNGIGKTTCAWFHPTGKRMLYASTHADPQARDKQKAEFDARATGKQRRYAWDFDPYYDLYDHDLASGDERRLTETLGYDAEASMSPEGRRIVFSSNRHAYAEPLSEDDRKQLELDPSLFVDLYVMNTDGGGVRRLTTTRGYDGGPFFSPDGKSICWRRFSEDGAKAEVFTMNADGTGERQITHLGAMSWAPFFHPSGEYLIFTTNLHGFDNFELYLVDVRGEREPVRVTFTAGFDGLPAFSPDGGRIAWTSTRTANRQGQLFIADWNHTEARRLLTLTTTRVKQQVVVRGPAETPGAKTDPAIRAADLRLYVSQLANDETEGRLTGTEGERRATEYVAEQFKRLGLLPAGDNGTYFQQFPFTAGVDLGPGNALAIDAPPPAGESGQNPARLGRGQTKVPGGQGSDAGAPQVNRDWRPLVFSKTGEIPAAPIVFAGYGIVAPASDSADEYDSYVHLDVKDKWALVFRFMPEDIAPERRQHLSRFASLRYKAMVLRDRGAAGMIVVSGPRAKVREQLVPLAFDATLSGTSIAAISITDDLAQRLLAVSGKDLEELQKQLDGGEPQMGFELPGVKLAATIDIKTVTKTGRNVLARLPAGPETADKPVLIIGAHVDHLGRGEASTSLAREDEKGQIHYGADDNASGTAGMIEIAEYLVGQRAEGKLALARDVIFAAWSGEELGLLGSAYCVGRLAETSVPPVAAHDATVSPPPRASLPAGAPSAEQAGSSGDLRSRVAAYLNMDMIGRLDQALIVNGVGSSSIWPAEIERRNAPLGLPLAVKEDSYLPTDATSFYLKGVPILSVWTGSHAEYHSPRDRPETLNYQGAEKVARFVALLARSLATSDQTPDYIAAATTTQPGARAGLRAYLGTIPDYAAGDVKGLKLSGVSKGGPAEQGGLQAGDVIVELAGRRIENIYDYTYAIDALKIGQPTKVVVLRDGQRLELTLTPGSRE